MSTLRELIESNKRLADATLGQSHSIDKLAQSFDRLRPAFEEIRRDLFDLKGHRDFDQAHSQLVLRGIDEKLALILDNAKDTQRGIDQVQREVTQPRVMLQPHDKETGIERAITAFGKLRTGTQIVLIILVLLAAASGWLAKLF